MRKITLDVYSDKLDIEFEVTVECTYEYFKGSIEEEPFDNFEFQVISVRLMGEEMNDTWFSIVEEELDKRADWLLEEYLKMVKEGYFG